MSVDFHIVGHTLCPYVQRVVITLLELDQPYERTNIKLDNKPDWLLALSPTQKVPVLIVDGQKVLFESQVIAEFLIEMSSHPFVPCDTLERAEHKAWIAYGDQILSLVAQIIYHTRTETEQRETFAKIAAMLAILDPQVRHAPYFDGDKFQLIDAVFSTVFRMLHVLASLAPFDLFAGLYNIAAWRDALSKRPSVIAAAPDQFDMLLRKFIAAKTSFAATQIR